MRPTALERVRTMSEMLERVGTSCKALERVKKDLRHFLSIARAC